MNDLNHFIDRSSDGVLLLIVAIVALLMLAVGRSTRDDALNQIAPIRAATGCLHAAGFVIVVAVILAILMR